VQIIQVPEEALQTEGRRHILDDAAPCSTTCGMDLYPARWTGKQEEIIMDIISDNQEETIMDMIIPDDTETHFHNERNARYSLYSKL